MLESTGQIDFAQYISNPVSRLELISEQIEIVAKHSQQLEGPSMQSQQIEKAVRQVKELSREELEMERMLMAREDKHSRAVEEYRHQ